RRHGRVGEEPAAVARRADHATSRGAELEMLRQDRLPVPIDAQRADGRLRGRPRPHTHALSVLDDSKRAARRPAPGPVPRAPRARRLFRRAGRETDAGPAARLLRASVGDSAGYPLSPLLARSGLRAAARETPGGTGRARAVPRSRARGGARGALRAFRCASDTAS